MKRILLFIIPLYKRLSIQPMLNDKPFGKPLRYYVFKLGYRFYFMATRPKLKINKIGSIAISPPPQG